MQSTGGQLTDMRDALIALQTAHRKLVFVFQLLVNEDDRDSTAFRQKAAQFSAQYQQLDRHSIEFLYHVEALTGRLGVLAREHSVSFSVVTYSLASIAAVLGIALSAMLIAGIRQKFDYLSRSVRVANVSISNDQDLPRVNLESDDEFARLADDLTRMFEVVQDNSREHDQLLHHFQILTTMDALTAPTIAANGTKSSRVKSTAQDVA